jgi:hypothetical protein
MPGFLFKVWSLARPCRARFFLGVLTGIVSGLTAPLMIGSILFVYGAAFPVPDATGASSPQSKRVATPQKNYAVSLVSGCQDMLASKAA